MAPIPDASQITKGTEKYGSDGVSPGADPDQGALHDDIGAALEHRQTSAHGHENTAEGVTIPVHEEELTVTTSTQETGRVLIEKDVVTEERTLLVPVTEEQVRVARHAVDRPVAPNESAFEGGTIEVPLTGEHVHLEKRARVAEEVVVSKEAVQHTRQVSGAIRHEEIRISDDEPDSVNLVTEDTPASIRP